MKQIIQDTMRHFNITGEGFSFVDPELEDLFQTYSKPRSDYWVYVNTENKPMGGAGVGSVKGLEDDNICELQKMYVDRRFHGQGMGVALLEHCLSMAKSYGYKHIYLETVAQLSRANQLYKKYGFRQLSQALGHTGHHKCDIRMLKDL
ncbi:MAG: GNAT family N-acetyltransferase [Pseudobacteriovorax sp.]|nr:GNAT family N-acetyltransferase [Pseudobacteriovorax sp.]